MVGIIGVGSLKGWGMWHSFPTTELPDPQGYWGPPYGRTLEVVRVRGEICSLLKFLKGRGLRFTVSVCLHRAITYLPCSDILSVLGTRGQTGQLLSYLFLFILGTQLDYLSHLHSQEDVAI